MKKRRVLFVLAGALAFLGADATGNNFVNNGDIEIVTNCSFVCELNGSKMTFTAAHPAGWSTPAGLTFVAAPPPTGAGRDSCARAASRDPGSGGLAGAVNLPD